ncbi:hypothetical protein ACOW01_23950, partial [Klebsiella pneumoniae]
AAHPFGASAARALFNACGVSPSPGTKFIATDLHGGPFLHSKPAEINISLLWSNLNGHFDRVFSPRQGT